MKNDAKSFIVRIWIESAAEGSENPIWRGVIEHVGSTERKHFNELSTVMKFIKEKTGLETPKTVADLWNAAKNWIRDELRKWLPDFQ